MSDNGTELMDFAPDDTLAGFRLQRIEVLNWGTFDGRVWTLHLNGRNALLTGDIGSGKSTLVDAVTALLVPSQRLVFNKAAGAEARERTLRSYVLGYFKTERSESSISARPVQLRDHSAYSVILGVFHNAGYEQTITLAQVLWFKEAQGQPERFHAGFEGELSIAGDFGRFDADITKLRRRLRTRGAELFDSFPPYGAWYRRRFGIENEQAMELFHQTVSMKSVGNLTDFVRSHMLEPFEVRPRLDALIAHFDDLHRAHEAVLKAKRQVELLTPLVGDCDRLAEVAAATEGMRRCREELRPYFARIKADLLEQRIGRLTEELARHDAHISRQEETKRGLQTRERELRRAIAENGGDRLAQLEEEMRETGEEQERRRKNANRYLELIRELGLRAVDDGDAFLAQRHEVAALIEAAASREAQVSNDEMEARVTFESGRQEHDALSAEIHSLKARRSNIDAAQIAIRERLLTAMDCPEQELPFAGELLQVRAEERDWEGAIERLVRGFGLSLLVPEHYYAQVAEWVDRTHLQGRLVYYRVHPSARRESYQRRTGSVADKIEIKQDSPFFDWLDTEVARRFDVVCCATQEQFRREPRAITRAGQIKAQDLRHEKDDRHRLDDRSRYILGWSNTEKIAVLESKARALEVRLGQMAGRIAALQEEARTLKARFGSLSKLEEFREFREIDWQPLAAAVARLEDEKRRLENASDKLQALNKDLEETMTQLAATEEQLLAQRDKQSRAQQRKSDAKELHAQTQSLVDAADAGSVGGREEIDALKEECLGAQSITVESCDGREQDMRQWLQARIDAEDKKLSRLRERIVDAMRSFSNAYPAETQEMDVSVESAGEYRAMLDKLQTDDLPRFEARFKELLNENTIREIANFHSQLGRERDGIRDRIGQINESLTQIDYNPGRYIRIEPQLTQDADIRDFQSELRQCTEGELTGSGAAQYSEAKFLQVKKIIERFRGREGQSDADRRWTAKVTDVRYWFSFAASERWREGDKEHEHYSDSGGKSGGQKEKLAYTVLAASLAYQFGLEWGAVRSRTFRFVVIDEAFGRGSDESAHYALKLFDRLHLQLLIVTPLQKIHVIEPYVRAVGFVQNDDGRASKLRNLTIEEYRAEKAGQSR